MYNRSMARSKAVPLDQLFRALADPTRLRLVNLMSEQEICVCYFIEVIGAPQPKISRHLAYLRRAGLVAARRQGKWMHYRLIVPDDSHSINSEGHLNRAEGEQRNAARSRASQPSLLWAKEFGSGAWRTRTGKSHSSYRLDTHRTDRKSPTLKPASGCRTSRRRTQA